MVTVFAWQFWWSGSKWGQLLHDKFDGQVYHGNSCCMTAFMVRFQMLTAVLHDNFDGHSQRQHWTHLKKGSITIHTELAL